MSTEGLDFTQLGAFQAKEEITPEQTILTEEIVVVPVIEETVNNLPEPPTVEEPIEDEEDAFAMFARELGIDNITRTDDFSGIVTMAKDKVNALETELSSFKNNPQVLALQAHLSNGGTLQNFIEVDTIENEFQNIQIDYNNDVEVENFAKWFYTNIKEEDDEDSIQSLIDSKKNKGTLKEFMQTQHNKLITTREAEISEYKAEKARETANELEETQKYYTELSTAFSKISLEKDLQDKIKQLSLPNNKGEVGIYDIYNNLNKEQTALMHSFAYKLANKIPIVYKTNEARKIDVPILAKKASQASSTFPSVTQFNKLINKTE